MAQALYRSTFLESWGSGIQRIIEACQEQGAEEPTWRWDGAFVYVTFKRPTNNDSNKGKCKDGSSIEDQSKGQSIQENISETVNDTVSETVNDTVSETVNDTVSETVNDTAKVILQTIADNPRITYQEIVDSTSIPRATVARHIAKLSASGSLIRHGADKNGYWEVKNKN